MGLVTCPECSAEHGKVATEAAFSDPATLAEWECRWLEMGTRVQVHGRPVSAVVDASKRETIEGITIYICADHACRRDDPSGPVPGAQWYPLAMLRIDP